MRHPAKHLALSAIIACSGIAGGARAADDCGGHWVRVGKTSIVLFNDDSAPQHMAIGVCDDQGNCTYTDKDGDTWTNHTESPGGAPDTKGRWTTVSGTGKYAQSTKNSGWTQPRRWDSTRPEGYVNVGNWGGSCK